MQPAYPMMPYPNTLVPSTADGVPLSGWWWRVLASIIDSVAIAIVVYGLLPVYAPGLITGVTQWFNDVMSSNSGSVPSIYDAVYGVVSGMARVSAAELVVATVYVFIMLRFLGATLGQMACGLRVVPVDKGRAPRGLPVVSVVLRILFYQLITSVISLISLIVMINQSPAMNSLASSGIMGPLSEIASIYTVVNVLWALWDKKRQCLHDKIARTQVIRAR
jgi:uncharacterized RDD family membrane protein YckC